MAILGKRSDYFGLCYMREASYGTDPGIVAASYVDGATETYQFVPTTALKAWIPLAEKPSGMPKRPLVEVPRIFSTHDFDTCKVNGIKDTGEFSITLNVHGPVVDYGTSGTTDRSCPPPWLDLAASACGLLKGLSGTGGPADTIATAADADTFTVTVGTVDEGHVISCNNPGSSTDFEIIRLMNVDAADSVATNAYKGVTWGFTSTPIAAEVVTYATQAAFDKRFEAVSESFTLLLQRADTEASLIFTGARCASWELNSKVGEIPTIKLSFIYRSYVYVTDAIDDEPDYVSLFPCPAVTMGAKCWITWDVAGNGTVDATDRKTDLEVSSFMAKWTAGYVRRKASTSADGIAEVIATQKGEFEVAIECLYDQDFQDYLGLCCSENFAELTFAYWEPSDDFVRTSATATRRGAWFVFIPSAHIIEDPGSEDEMDAIMYQKIRLSAGNYTADGAAGVPDAGVFATTAHINTKFLLGVV